jgi:UDP-4-amino-4,6-dideoxy-N-acetyl-beta-L-altrosamine transaminase
MIPYGKQTITDADIREVSTAVGSDFITQGPRVECFEKDMSQYVGCENGVAVNSGTSALHISCLALGAGKGDYIWTSAMSFVASSNCALYCGSMIDFVDIDKYSGLMCINSLEEKLQLAKKKGQIPKILIPVHFAGQPCDMERIYELSCEYGFKIIEDACHALGAEYESFHKVGSCQYSDITVFSFHPVKMITTGEGGMAMTNDKVLATVMKRLRSHGVVKTPNMDPWYYEQIEIGFNYRMTDISASLGVSQLTRIDEFVNKRIKIANMYNSKIINKDIVPIKRNDKVKSSFHLYPILTSGSKERRDLYDLFHENNIRVQVHYIPIYKQPYYKRMQFDAFPNCEYFYDRVLSIPIFPSLTVDDQCSVISILNEF